MLSRPTRARRALFEYRAREVRHTKVMAELEVVANCTIEGELVDLIDEFSDGRIQFAFLKIKDQNTSLPKSVLIAWVRTF